MPSFCFLRLAFLRLLICTICIPLPPGLVCLGEGDIFEIDVLRAFKIGGEESRI
jgi:hypothetical protein